MNGRTGRAETAGHVRPGGRSRHTLEQDGWARRFPAENIWKLRKA